VIRLLTALSRSRRSVLAEESGASAVEFALFAPVLCLALLTTIDLGTALSQRMSLGHVLRSGAQVAMEDPGTAKVERVLESTAKRNFRPRAPTRPTIRL
jgi:pilus assembly protein CpaE